MNRESATISASTAAACNGQQVSICDGLLSNNVAIGRLPSGAADATERRGTYSPFWRARKSAILSLVRKTSKTQICLNFVGKRAD